MSGGPCLKCRDAHSCAAPADANADASTPDVAIEVVCAVLRRGRRFLSACRPEGTPHAGFWEFPGGKMEPGESPETALAREISEELGVAVHQQSLWKTLHHNYPARGGYPARCVTLHVYIVDEFVGEPVPVEGQSLRWVSPEEAQELPFLEADTTLVRELCEMDAACQCRG